MKENVDVISNEISIDELCEFMVEEVFNKYPRFVYMLGGISITKARLRSNIHEVKRYSVDLGMKKAEYNLSDRTINVFSTKKMSISDIKSNTALLHIFTHECIHAVLNRTKGFSKIATGCFLMSRNAKHLLRRALAISPRLLIHSEHESLKEKIVKEKYFRDMLENELGEALNEGLTEWLVMKMLGNQRLVGNYPMEMDYISIIEMIKGQDAVLSFAIGNFDSMMDTLHMNIKQLVVFLKCTDMISNFTNNMSEEEQKALDVDTRKVYEDFHKYAQNIFLEKFIDSEIEQSIESGNINTKKLFNLYRGVVKMHRINVVSYNLYDFEKLYDGPAYKGTREKLEDLYVLNSKKVQICESSESEISVLYAMYNDLKNDKNDKMKYLPQQFEEFITGSGNHGLKYSEAIYGATVTEYGENIPQNNAEGSSRCSESAYDDR